MEYVLAESMVWNFSYLIPHWSNQFLIFILRLCKEMLYCYWWQIPSEARHADQKAHSLVTSWVLDLKQTNKKKTHKQIEKEQQATKFFYLRRKKKASQKYGRNE